MKFINKKKNLNRYHAHILKLRLAKGSFLYKKSKKEYFNGKNIRLTELLESLNNSSLILAMNPI